MEEIKAVILHAIAHSEHGTAQMTLPALTTEERRRTHEQVVTELRKFAADNHLDMIETPNGFDFSPTLEIVELTHDQADKVALMSAAHITLAGYTVGGALGMVSVNIRDKESTIMLFKQGDEPIFGWRINGGNLRTRRARVMMTKERIERSLADE